MKFIDNRASAVLSVREPWPAGSQPVGTQRHRYLWARMRSNGSWTVEHLAWAGSELYRTQPDYTGLASLDPSTSQRVVISTDVHPVTEAPLVSAADGQRHYELWEGYRTGEGIWEWTALTVDSAADNLRPVIASNGNRKALAWMRGTYTAYFNWNTQLIVRST